MLINFRLNMYGKILKVNTKIREIKYITSKPVKEVKWIRKNLNPIKEKGTINESDNTKYGKIVELREFLYML